MVRTAVRSLYQADQFLCVSVDHGKLSPNVGLRQNSHKPFERIPLTILIPLGVYTGQLLLRRLQVQLELVVSGLAKTTLSFKRQLNNRHRRITALPSYSGIPHHISMRVRD